MAAYVSTVEAEMNFNSVPSGREVLTAKAEKVISEYNKCVEEDEKQLEETKKAVQDMSEMMIRTLEEKMYKKQMRMNEKMQEILLEINTKLEEDLEGQEEELASPCSWGILKVESVARLSFDL